MADELDPAVIKQIVKYVEQAMRHDGPLPQPGMLRLPEDERLRATVADIVERQLAQFEKKVEEIVHKELSDTLRRIGIRIDDEHIDQTADDFRSMMKTHRSMTRMITGLGITLVTGIFFGLLKLLGLNVGSFGGEH